MDIKSVILWGYPLHSHTHSYIHNAFKRAFELLNYKCYWFDDNTPQIEYENVISDKSLFITEGRVSKNIVLNPKSYYLLHNCDMDKYRQAGIPEDHLLGLQVFTKDCLPRSQQLNNSKFIRFDGKTLYMPWATDLFPQEIEENIKKIEVISKSYKSVCHFVGMILDNPWKPCMQVCQKNNISFASVGGFSGNNVSIEENIKRVQESLIAPAFQEPWQTTNGYIPCRIFKNISYGKMGITNNEVVQELFEGKLIFNTDVSVATQISIDNVQKGENIELLKELMVEVKNNHTYLNRIEDIFQAFSKLK